MKRATAELTLRKPGWRRIWALACLALFLGLQVFASSICLHKVIHAEAGSPDHHCAVTLLTHGLLNVVDATPVSTSFVSLLLFVPPSPKSAGVPSVDHRLASSRAPPALL